MNIKLNLSVEVMFNQETGVTEVISCKTQGSIEEDSKIVTMELALTETQVKFGILTLGARSMIGRILPPAKDLQVLYMGQDKRYPAKTHKSVKGRIDGITSFYNQHTFLTPGSKVKISYNKENALISVQLI